MILYYYDCLITVMATFQTVLETSVFYVCVFSSPLNEFMAMYTLSKTYIETPLPMS